MAVLNPLAFQREAVDKLVIAFLKVWRGGERRCPLVFKSPTGSGKTFMMANFINELNNLPQWDEDKAFIWITFSDDLAMQSRDKFQRSFENTLKNDLLTVDDFNRGKLSKNNILFVNWQKLVSRRAEDRRLRRPEDEAMHKETGVYFEDFIDRTHEDGREIVLIVDESHTHRTTELAGNVIDYISPRIMIDVSATPKAAEIPSPEDIEEGRAGFVYVKREDVVDEGLIKEKIVVQTQEEVERVAKTDLDEALLRLGLVRRAELALQFQAFGKAVNPLMLIQLPNDDARLEEIGERKKADIVLEYLRNKGVDIDAKVAMWFDANKKNLEFIEENNSEVDFLLFKQAAGTGWDCPRAHVLVMFREIQSQTFYAQTVGRILRMAEPEKAEDYVNTPDLRTGFLYTNYRRDEIRDVETVSGSKPETFFSFVREGCEDVVEKFELASEFIPRVDYGDIANSAKFQRTLSKSFNEYFGITEADLMDRIAGKLKAKGLEINAHLDTKLVVDAEFEDFDRMSLEFTQKGDEYEHEMSDNDIGKLFNYFCYKVLTEQTDEDARVTNVARSWNRLKAALRVWNMRTLNFTNMEFYKIFLNDMYREAASVFRPAITKALKDYRPILDKVLRRRKERIAERSQPVFRFRESYAFTEEYEKVPQGRCLFERCYLRKDYAGRETERMFVEYIDSMDTVDWWFKNGDHGKDYFALKYFNTAEQSEKLFYPDWIIRFSNGKIGIFDTKAEGTLNTAGRARGLAVRLKELDKGLVGGIVRYANGIFEYCTTVEYDDIAPKNNQWRQLSELFA
jgi:type III restriction enzyme